jgi:peptidoglycan-associated lipoprotein
VPAPLPTPADFAALGFDRVFFANDVATLDQVARATLDRQVDWLTRYPRATVRIEGNTDVNAGHAYNLPLGQRRANAVRDYLIANGVAASRISTARTNAESQPIASGTDAESLARNRNAQTIVVSVAP